MLRDAEPGRSRALRLLRRAVLIEAGELRPVLLAGAFFFCVLASYGVLRPIRDEMAVRGDTRNLPWLFTGTLAGMLLLHPLFTSLVSRTSRARFIQLCYRFFALNLIAFYFAIEHASPAAQVWIGRGFFIWTSVFNLFVVSVFWGFVVDVFRSDQAKRVFGFIAVGGTLGAIAGGLLTAQLVEPLGPANLLWISVALLEAAVGCAWGLGRWVAREPRPADPDARTGAVIGGGTWDGLRHVARSPYLANYCLFILLFTVGSTFLYVQRLELVAAAGGGSAARTASLAWFDVAVQTATLFAQLFLTGRILERLGLAAGLVFLPLLSIVGFASLAMFPMLGALTYFEMLRRAGNFALMRPSREVLFTVVPRSDKYKAKNFIDNFVYRFGDQIGIWSYALLVWLGLSFPAVALIAAALSAGWALNAFWLARRQRLLASTSSSSRLDPIPSPE